MNMLDECQYGKTPKEVMESEKICDDPKMNKIKCILCEREFITEYKYCPYCGIRFMFHGWNADRLVTKDEMDWRAGYYYGEGT